MKILLTFLLAAFCTATAPAAQIGDTVESKVPLANLVPIPRNQAVAVTHIDLEDGVWDVSGSVQIFEGNMNQVAIAGGSINTVIALAVDGTEVFLELAPPNFFAGISVPSHAIQIVGSGTLFLVAYNQSAQTSLQAGGWGFISARKIRNNH
jgi:hypothetical protein